VRCAVRWNSTNSYTLLFLQYTGCDNNPKLEWFENSGNGKPALGVHDVTQMMGRKSDMNHPVAEDVNE